MKNKSIITLVLFFMGLGVFSSCDDMLTPDLERYAKKSGQDTLYSYLGILKSMQNISERYVLLGESRGDLVSTSTYTNDSIGRLYNFDNPADGESGLLRVADYYKVINGCNFYLAEADTASLKDNVYYMRKEYAQVQAMRAWTYLQLVQNYGSVPFVTEPVKNTEDGIRLEKNATRATKDNLVDLLVAAGLGRAEELQQEYGYPSYLTYNTGNASVPSASCFFPVRLVMADLYLLKGDYANAATKYYLYMRDEAPRMVTNRATFTEIERDGAKMYMENGTTWSNRFRNYTANTNNDLSVMIPGAANSHFGTVLTAVQNVYGFSTSSTNSTSSNRDNDETSTDDEVVSTSGSISVTPDPTYLQLVPSASYVGLNQAQAYSAYRTDNTGQEVFEYYNCGDARLDATAARHRNTLNNNLVINRFISKFCPPTGTNFNAQERINYANSFRIFYGVQLYRKAMIYLRFAEAINRDGFPEYAFAVLKDGLSTSNLPTVSTHTVVTYDTIPAVIDGVDSFRIDTTVQENVPYLVAPVADATTGGGVTYIDLDEAQRARTKLYLNFSDVAFNTTNAYGVHSLGCGDTRGMHDTIYTYDKMVAQKIIEAKAEENGWDDAEVSARITALATKGITNAVADGEYTQDDVINAVEDLIIDELALETAFEGNRYPDLLRFAAHKGNGSIDNEWLARKIARRGYTPSQKGYDAALYSKLATGSYWYLQLPEQ